MEADKILSASILDIIFERRNKEYGAYELRLHHNRRVLTGLLVMASVTASLFIIQGIPSRHSHGAAATVHIADVQLEQIQAEKNLPPPPPPPPVEPPKVAQIKFTAPRIVKDEEVKSEDKPPEQEKLLDTRIGTVNQEGARDSGIVAPTDKGVPGGVVEAPKHQEDNNYDRIFTKVEIESQYPGGNNAWLRYLNKNFRYPEDALNNNIQGTVIVQFIVDQIGNVSDVHAISGPELGGLRDEAVRVIRTSGQWLPAIQNGAKVKSYKRQPVVFIVESSE